MSTLRIQAGTTNRINRQGFFMTQWVRAGIAMLMLLVLPQSYAAVNEAAYQVVDVATKELLDKIEANRDQYQEDVEVFYADLDQVLAPYIDYKRIARRIMGKYYKQASQDQREAFVIAVKDSLKKVYAKGLLAQSGYRVEILPLKPSKNNRTQKVNVKIHTASGNVIPIQYSMFKSKKQQQRWMMENVIVQGYNIGITYRGVFARLMKSNKKDIDLVIADWAGAAVKSNSKNADS